MARKGLLLMRLLGTQVSLQYGAFEIYLSGCKPPHCRGCHNPESWDFERGTEITHDLVEKLKKRILSAEPLVERVWILGGEPLDQPLDELEDFLRQLSQTYKPIWLFTRYEKDHIPESILSFLSAVKTGPFIPEKRSEMHEEYGVRLASTNQHIYRI